MIQGDSRLETWYFDPSNPRGGFPADPDSALRQASSARRIRVLVVDDEPTITETLVEILNGEGFDAVAASNSDSALSSAETFAPDVIISDVVMPGMNGVQLGLYIRKLLPKCRIILFSGQTATVDLLRDARSQGHEFEIVPKPIKPQTLISMIRRGASN
ncbi:MAG: response regulator [Candidatus Acidiferrales bacterium]